MATHRPHNRRFLVISNEDDTAELNHSVSLSYKV